LLIDKLLEVLEVTVLLGQFDLRLIFAMNLHSELEQIDAFPALNDFITEPSSNEWPFDVF